MTNIDSVPYKNEQNPEFKICVPHPILSNYIKYYWLLKDDGNQASTAELMLPDGYGEIIFNRIKEPYQRWEIGQQGRDVVDGSYVIANNGKSIFAQRVREIDMIGVKLSTAGLYNLFKVPIHEFSKSPVTFEELENADINLLETRLYEKHSLLEVKTLLDEFFMRRISMYEENHFTNAVHTIHAHRGLINVESVAKKLNVHYSTLERCFKKHAGLTPKDFQKLLRFRYSYLDFKSNPHQFLSERKYYSWDYYDQSHFIKEFASFLSVSPTRFIASKTDYSVAVSHQHLDQQSATRIIY